MSAQTQAANLSRPKSSNVQKERRWIPGESLPALLFILPSLIGFLLFYAVPAVRGLYISFTDWDLLRPEKFIGIQNYMKLFSDPEFYNALKVTLYYVLLNIPFQTILAIIIAVMMSRFPFRNTLFTIYIAALMVPGIVTLIPNFILVRQVNLMNTYVGIAAPFLLMTPYAVFFLRQFFLGLNREVEEASRIDGATVWVGFVRVILPMMIPAITTLAIITLISTWNNYLWPMIVGSDESVRVLTVALGIFRSQTPQGAPDWTGLMAGTTLAIIPTFAIFLLLGRRILDSIQFTGFK